MMKFLIRNNMKKTLLSMKIMQWVLAAILMTSGLGMLGSCQQIVEEQMQDVVCQWVADYTLENVDPETGLAFNRVVEVYEFSEKNEGFYECYLLNGDELVNAEYVRGENGDFHYDLDGAIDLRSTMKQRKLDICLDVWIYLLDRSSVWTVKYDDGFLDDGDHIFTPSTEAQREQILKWYENRHNAGLVPGIAMISKAGQMDYWRQIESSFRSVCQEKGFQAIYSSTSADNAYSEQLVAVKELGKLKKDALKAIIYTPCYGPNGESAEKEVAALAKERGIPVIVFDTHVKSTSPLAAYPFIGTDNAGAGMDLAAKVTAGSVAAFAKVNTPGVERGEAFMAIKPATYLVTVGESAASEVEAVMNDYDDFVFFNGSNLTEVFAKLKSAGKNVYVFDVYKEFLDELIAGGTCLKGIMAQNTFLMARKAVEAAVAGAKEGELISTFYITSDNLDAEEVQPFLEYYGKK